MKRSSSETSGISDPEMDIPQRMRREEIPSRTLVRRYVLAALGAAVAILLTYFIAPLRQSQSFLTITAAVAVSAGLGGLGPGLVSMVVAAIGWCWLIVPPDYSLVVNNFSDLARLFVFVVLGLLISSLHGARRRAEAALKESQQRLALALDAVQMGVWTYDMRTGVFWLSPRMKQILGIEEYNSATTYGCFLSRVYPEDRPRVVQAMTCTLEDNAKYVLEHRVLDAEQQLRWIITRGRTFINARGEVECMMGVAAHVAHHAQGALLAEQEV